MWLARALSGPPDAEMLETGSGSLCPHGGVFIQLFCTKSTSQSQDTSVAPWAVDLGWE